MPSRPPSRPYRSVSRPSQRKLGSRCRAARLSLKLMRSVRVAWPLNPPVRLGMNVPICCTGKTTAVSAPTSPLWKTSRLSTRAAFQVCSQSWLGLAQAASRSSNFMWRAISAVLTASSREAGTVAQPASIDNAAHPLARESSADFSVFACEVGRHGGRGPGEDVVVEVDGRLLPTQPASTPGIDPKLGPDSLSSRQGSPCNTLECAGAKPWISGPYRTAFLHPVELDFLLLSGEQECANSHS